MVQYIPKDALVAEIDRQKIGYNVDGKHSVEYDTTRKILNIIDTLEVKKIDLEKETEKWWKEHLHLIPKNQLWMDAYQSITLAKHFFELGMQVNNPITAADRGTAEEIIINLKRVEQDYRIDLTKEIGWVRNKAQKGEEI